jgi:hypothetical protein
LGCYLKIIPLFPDKGNTYYGIILGMARTSGPQSLGNTPPQVVWTVVRGDTASFKVYVTDDAKQPLNVPDWDISMKVKRPNNSADAGIITDDATVILTLTPEADPDDLAGEFTVFLAADESEQLETGDIFDIQLSDPTRVWTVAQGSMRILEDVTD